MYRARLNLPSTLPRRARGSLVFALLLTTTTALAACNSDETFSITTEDETTGVNKTPSTSLPMTTRGEEPDMGGSSAEFVSCQDMMTCLFVGGDGKAGCQFVKDGDIYIDTPCILECIGIDGVDFTEVLWKLDLGFCLVDVCSQIPYSGPDDPGPDFECNPDPTLMLDLSSNCISCVVTRMASIANGEDINEIAPTCVNEFNDCDDDPNTP